MWALSCPPQLGDKRVLGYQFYFLDGGGHIQQAAEFEWVPANAAQFIWRLLARRQAHWRRSASFVDLLIDTGAMRGVARRGARCDDFIRGQGACRQRRREA